MDGLGWNEGISLGRKMYKRPERFGVGVGVW